MIAEIIKPEVISVSTWITALDTQYKRYKRAGWEFIFLLRDGINALADTEHERMTLYQDASNQIGLAVHTLQNYVSSARKPCANLAQELGLEIGHLDAVAGLDNEMAEDALKHAGENLWTITQLRGHVFAVKQPITPIPDIGNQTPTADHADRILAHDDPPYADNRLYKEYDFTLPDEYNPGAYIAIPREPVAAARMLRQQFNADELDTLVAELIR